MSQNLCSGGPDQSYVWVIQMHPCVPLLSDQFTLQTDASGRGWGASWMYV